jgi:hypothetical protein
MPSQLFRIHRPPEIGPLSQEALHEALARFRMDAEWSVAEVVLAPAKVERKDVVEALDGVVRHSVSAGPSIRDQAQAHIALLESHRMWDGHATDYTVDMLKRLVAALPNDDSQARQSPECAGLTPVETFTAEEVQQAIRSFLIYGEDQYGKSHQGYFSGSGFAARVLRFHLDRLTSDNRKSEDVP